MPEWLKTCLGLLLGIAGIAICAAFWFVVDYQNQKRAIINSSTTLCPEQSTKKIWAGLHEIIPPPIERRTAIVVDSTDRIAAHQRDEIQDWIQTEFVSSLSRFEQVSIYSLSDFSELGRPIFSKCAPPGKANPWIENPRLVREKFEKDFLQDLLAVVDSLASVEEADSSPILEMLEKVSREADRVVFISDLMHHTDDFSLYRSPRGEHDYQILADTEYAENFGAALADTHLSVLLLPRTKLRKQQTSQLQDFWDSHMRSNGGQFSIQQTLSAAD